MSSSDDEKEMREVIYDNSDRYVGEFKAGKRHGKGAYYYHDGSKYEGEYKNGKRAGKGTYTSVHGDKYFGEWKDGESHGEGVYQYVNGDRYEGEFRDDVPHGKGPCSSWQAGTATHLPLSNRDIPPRQRRHLRGRVPEWLPPRQGKIREG